MKEDTAIDLEVKSLNDDNNKNNDSINIENGCNEINITGSLIDNIENDKKEPSINNIINESSMINYNVFTDYQKLHEFLSKDKLIAIYKKNVLAKGVADRKGFLLNRNFYEYFKRKKIYRAICEDNAEQALEIYTKYRNLLSEYDKIIAIENYVRKDSETKLITAKETEINASQECDESLLVFTKLLKDTGIALQSSKTGLTLSEKEIDAIIKRMVNIQKALSIERTLFIETQDYTTEIDQKAQKLEDLGNGLRMIDFEQLRAEVQSLSDKIEERTNELTKLRLRCYSDTQILAHYREKEFMIRNTLNKKQNTLKNELQYELEEIRNDVGKYKLKRDQLRKQYLEMTENCGLLNKPNLLINYDDTVNKINNEKLAIDVISKETAAVTIEMNKILSKVDQNNRIKSLRKTESQIFDEQLRLQLQIRNKPCTPRIRQGITMVRSYFKNK